MQYTYIGVDVSKSDLTIAYLKFGSWVKEKISNNQEAIRFWLNSLSVESPHVIFEATGSYSSKLAHVLNAEGYRFTIISPNQSSSFSKLRGISTKDDDRDAILLSEYGAQFNPNCTPLPSESERILKQKLMVLRGLEKSHRLLSNQLHAIDQAAVIDSQASEVLTDCIKSIEEQIAKIEQGIASLLQTDPLRKISDLMLSVKGVGPKIVASIWAEIGNPSRFDNAKQFAKFAGLTPILSSSGKGYKKSAIPKRKGSKLRSNLYMAVMSAIQYNKPCKALFERLRAKNKPERIVHWAVAHKMLRQVWGVVNAQRPFDNSVDFIKK